MHWPAGYCYCNGSSLCSMAASQVVAWQKKRTAKFVALFVSILIVGGKGVSGTSTLDVEQGSCTGRCEIEYLRRLRRADSVYAERVAQFMCPYKVERRSDAEILIVASPGTTGTRSLAQYLADGCGMMVHHWDRAIRPGDPGTMVETLVKAELDVLKNNMSVGIAEIDAFMADDDLIGHVLQPIVPSVASSELGLQRVDVIADDPVDRIFYDLFKQFPRAKFVLLERDSAEWQASRVEHHGLSQVPVLRGPASWQLAQVSAAVGRATFEAYQELIRCLVPPERLLVVNYFAGGEDNTLNVQAAIAAFLAPKRNCLLLPEAPKIGN